jgi:hypothetical protein
MIKKFEEFTSHPRKYGKRVVSESRTRLSIGDAFDKMEVATKCLSTLYNLYREAENFRIQEKIEDTFEDLDENWCCSNGDILLYLAACWAEYEPDTECTIQNIDEVSQNEEIKEDCFAGSWFETLSDEAYYFIWNEIKNDNHIFEIMSQLVDILKNEEFSHDGRTTIAWTLHQIDENGMKENFIGEFVKAFLTNDWVTFSDNI